MKLLKELARVARGPEPKRELVMTIDESSPEDFCGHKYHKEYYSGDYPYDIRKAYERFGRFLSVTTSLDLEDMDAEAAALLELPEIEAFEKWLEGYNPEGYADNY